MPSISIQGIIGALVAAGVNVTVNTVDKYMQAFFEEMSEEEWDKVVKQMQRHHFGFEVSAADRERII